MKLLNGKKGLGKSTRLRLFHFCLQSCPISKAKQSIILSKASTHSNMCY